MNILKYIRQLDYKWVILVFILMGITDGFSTLSNNAELEYLLLFSLYGLVIGGVIGLLFTILLNSWKTNPKIKASVLWIFVLFGIAPMFLAFFDGEEHINSNRGLIIMLVIDIIALSLLALLIWNDKRKLIPLILTVPIWQLICLYWFVGITWKEMNYWD